MAAHHATLGVAKVTPPDPNHFLRKFSGKPKSVIPKRKKVDKSKAIPKKPLFETTEKPSEPCKCDGKPCKKKEELKTKNFALEEIKYVDTRNGHRCDLLKSGMIPLYINKQATNNAVKYSFGKPPSYLLKRMRAKEFEERNIRDVAEIKALPKCRYLTRQEREELLNGLKLNWDQKQKEYQLLPIITDTIPKINKKVKLEQALMQLEKDICLIEKHPYIYLDEGDTEASTQK